MVPKKRPLKVCTEFFLISFATSGSFVCQEGTTDVTYRDWGRGEPNNVRGDEDCGVVWEGTGKWNDIGCDYIGPAICKRPLSARLHF